MRKHDYTLWIDINKEPSENNSYGFKLHEETNPNLNPSQLLSIIAALQNQTDKFLKIAAENKGI